ncbi:MAG TPA: hypothetical protein VJU78_06960 [Chitinophagaceae bacterium]|nr:hypothetical protein [Chitinophagaceae bacterium]
MPKTILLLYSFLITLLELQAQTKVFKGKVADADTGVPLAGVPAGIVGGTTQTSERQRHFQHPGKGIVNSERSSIVLKLTKRN